VKECIEVLKNNFLSGKISTKKAIDSFRGDVSNKSSTTFVAK
jgi:hypothetical protein